jgi:hypothetical protein
MAAFLVLLVLLGLISTFMPMRPLVGWLADEASRASVVESSLGDSTDDATIADVPELSHDRPLLASRANPSVGPVATGDDLSCGDCQTNADRQNESTTTSIVPDDELAIELVHEAAAGPELAETREPAIAGGPVARPVRPLNRVGIQAGHWRSAELPDELARLRGSTGTAGGGVAEWQLNLDVAERVAEILRGEGLQADVLPATVPPGYAADAFIALHADGDASGRLSGFKLARASRSPIPEVDDALLAAITEEYQAATGLPIDTHVSRNMTGYYAFSHRRFEHSVSPATPAVILEMGFMTNRSDLRMLLSEPDRLAIGVARGILRFLEERGYR